MLKKILQITSVFFNILIFLVLAAILIRFLWIYFGENYVDSLPVGGDYFNALTYQLHFSKYLPHPVSGWLPFWHAGSPIIGGYPFLSFYLTNFLTRFFDIVTAFNFFSASTLILFGIASLALFWQVSKSWVLTITLTVILVTTKATYYQLAVGGFITAATSQWFLPTVLFFTWRFGETSKTPYLILASVFSGFALLAHAASNILMIFAPSALVLFAQPNLEKISKKIATLVIFTAISFAIGSTGVFTVFAQQFLGAGAQPCANRECWGDYPRHLQLWLTILAPLLAGYFLALSLFIKVFKRNLNLKFVTPALAGLMFFILYIGAAYLKLINQTANVFFPTRFFWGLNLFILLCAASLFAAIRKTLPVHSHFLAVIAGLVIILTILAKPTFPHVDRPNTIPPDVATYILPKYQTNKVSDLVPEWILTADKNWRVDIFQPGIYQWFSAVSELPTTRGSSNAPLGSHSDWLYYLQTATRNADQSLDPELIKNKILFLLDAYGVGFIENSMTPYPNLITDDKELILNYSERRNSIWYQLSPKFTTPIVSPTNTQPLLFVGDNGAYNNFIRILSMTNLNSKVLIPVKGPKSVKAISDKDLSTFPILFLYQYSGSDLNKLTNYVKNGGRLYIETTSEKSYPKGELPEIFPIESINLEQAQGGVNFKILKTETSENVNLLNFSQFSYQGGKWKLFYSDENSIRNFAKPILLINNKPVVVEGSLDKGHIIWSGLNLPFHIVVNNNFDEAKLFKNIFSALTEVNDNKNQSEFSIERPKPENIKINSTNYKGIYFKENYNSGWKATVNGKSVKIYKAGLDFMYIPVSQNDKVSIIFKGSILNWALFYLTVITIILSLIFLIFPKLPMAFFSFLNVRWQKKLKTKFKRWTEDEST